MSDDNATATEAILERLPCMDTEKLWDSSSRSS